MSVSDTRVGSKTLTEQDKYWIGSTQAAITRARRILLTTTLIAAWLIAVQLIELIEWEPIRRPATENYARALVYRLQSFSLAIPDSAVRDADRPTAVSATTAEGSTESTSSSPEAVPGRPPSGYRPNQHRARPLAPPVPSGPATSVRLDSIKVSASARASEAAAWCEAYRRYIRYQWSSDLNLAVDMLITRAKISSEALPPSTITRPQVGLPLLGIPVAADDATLFGAIMLFIAMLWLCFAGFQARDSMKVLRERCSDPDFAKAWLPHQFLFVNQPAQAPERVAYPLMYLPYGAVLFGFLVNVSGIVVQVFAYSKLAGFPGVPLVDGPTGLPWFEQETLGILCVRYAIELAAIFYLLWFADSAWETFCAVHEEGTAEETIKARKIGDKWRLVFLTFAVFVVIGVWTWARLMFLDEIVAKRGWVYGPTLVGAIVVMIVGLAFGLVFTYLVQGPPWKRPGGGAA